MKKPDGYPAKPAGIPRPLGVSPGRGICCARWFVVSQTYGTAGWPMTDEFGSPGKPPVATGSTLGNVVVGVCGGQFALLDAVAERAGVVPTPGGASLTSPVTSVWLK